jgi:hypothetical protein
LEEKYTFADRPAAEKRDLQAKRKGAGKPTQKSRPGTRDEDGATAATLGTPLYFSTGDILTLIETTQPTPLILQL